MTWFYIPCMEFPSLVESLGLTSAFNTSLETLAPFVMLKGKCLTRKSFIKICKKESYTMPQYIPMLSPSHQLLITSLKKWISLLPVSHVSHFLELAQENQLKTKDGYGIQYLKPLAKLNHRSYSWRTFQTSLMNGKHLMKFQNPFPKSGSILNGQMYERPILGPIIKESVCSYLHTNQEAFQIFMLPTPTLDTSMRKKKYSQGGRSLSFAINQLNISQPNGGEKNRLSPLFVEWMMGFPTLWTDLEV